MTETNLLPYVDYFRQLAVQHYLLNHNPLSETGDAPQDGQHFAKWNLNEVVSGLRTKVGYPCMLLELYETQTSSQMVYDIKQYPKGAFTIIDHVKEGDTEGEEQAYALTESIVYDMLKRIWQDHYGKDKDRCQTPFYQFHFDKTDISSTGKILTNEMGWRCEFSFEFQKTIKIQEAPAPGTFAGDGDAALGDSGYLGADNANDILVNAQT